MVKVKALDCSAYSGPESLELRRWQVAYNEGYRLVVVQAWGGGPAGMGPNPYCSRQLTAAREAGLKIAVYVWLPPDNTTDTSSLMALAKQACGDEWAYVRFVAFDIEASANVQLHPVNPDARLADAMSHTLGEKPGIIYSSRHMWQKLMGNSKTFRQFPLWEANYDGDERLSVPPTFPDGWTFRAMKQYAGTSDVAGLVVDLNTADTVLLGIEDEGEADPTGELRAQIKALKAEMKVLRNQKDAAEEKIRLTIQALENTVAALKS